MIKLFSDIQELSKSGFIFRIQDAGPETIDRITVLFCDGDYLALSQTGAGFSMWGEAMDPMVMHERAESGNAVDLAFGDLSVDLQHHILYRVNEAFQDVMGRMESQDSKVVAPSRSLAVENEGIFSSTGTGLYRKGNAYFVRLDGPEEDDRGPYESAREAYIASLPDEHGLSGMEYQSPLNASTLIPTPGVQDTIAELEAKQSS